MRPADALTGALKGGFYSDVIEKIPAEGNLGLRAQQHAADSDSRLIRSSVLSVGVDYLIQRVSTGAGSEPAGTLEVPWLNGGGGQDGAEEDSLGSAQPNLSSSTSL